MNTAETLLPIIYKYILPGLPAIGLMTVAFFIFLWLNWDKILIRLKRANGNGNGNGGGRCGISEQEHEIIILLQGIKLILEEEKGIIERAVDRFDTAIVAQQEMKFQIDEIYEKVVHGR